MQRLTILLAFVIGLLMCLPSHAPVQAQGGNIVLSDSADVTGTGAVVHAASSGFARYVDAFAVSGSGIRCGGSAVSATVGKPIAAGNAYHWQAMPQDARLSTSAALYSLVTVSCYVPNLAVVNFSWAN